MREDPRVPLEDREADDLVEKSRRNTLSEQELIQCVKDRRTFVVNNALLRLLVNETKSDALVEVLASWLRRPGDGVAIYRNGPATRHFFMAALRLMDTQRAREEYAAQYAQLDDAGKEKAGTAVLVLTDLVKNYDGITQKKRQD